VFLLSRIHERWALAGDTVGAIVDDMASTVRLITGAATIIIVDSACDRLVAFQEMGFGSPSRFALDATLLCLLLIPAAIRLLGEHNWYLPSAGLAARPAGRRPPASATASRRAARRPKVPSGAVPVGSWPHGKGRGVGVTR
jgi:RND superfamily putative drug exporter